MAKEGRSTLIDEVTTADDLDVNVEEFFLRRLTEVEVALREVLLTGNFHVEAATESLVGATQRRPNLWDRIAPTRWGPRVEDLTVGLCMALSAAGGLPELVPGDTPQPLCIVHESHVAVEVNVQDSQESADDKAKAHRQPRREDTDVVDTEVVDERERGSSTEK